MVTTTPLTDTPTLPITDIYVKTYSRDAEYHKYCVRSIEKFCSGFRNLVVENKEQQRGYMAQQSSKMYSDTHTDAEFILVTDSDTLFVSPVTPQTFMVDGKPIWIHTPWTPEMLTHPGTAAWKRVMTEFFGSEPNSEKMRRQPFVFPRKVLQTLREYCFQKHRKSLDDYIMGADAFSEWNVLGEHCWRHHHDMFHWVDSSVDPLPELTVLQTWSHDPLEKNVPTFNQILA